MAPARTLGVRQRYLLLLPGCLDQPPSPEIHIDRDLNSSLLIFALPAAASSYLSTYSSPPDGDAVANNPLQIMVAFITRDTDTYYYPVWARFENHNTAAGALLPRQNTAPNPYPTVDTQLKNTIARCMIIDDGYHPGLAQVLGTARERSNLPPASFNNPMGDYYESDEQIRNILQVTVYNADPPPVVASAAPSVVAPAAPPVVAPAANV